MLKVQSLMGMYTLYRKLCQGGFLLHLPYDGHVFYKMVWLLYMYEFCSLLVLANVDIQFFLQPTEQH